MQAWAHMAGRSLFLCHYRPGHAVVVECSGACEVLRPGGMQQRQPFRPPCACSFPTSSPLPSLVPALRSPSQRGDVLNGGQWWCVRCSVRQWWCELMTCLCASMEEASSGYRRLLLTDEGAVIK